MTKTNWGPGVIIQNDARLGDRDPIRWLIIKRMKGWVLMVGLTPDRNTPPTRKMREKEFAFMTDRGAYRYVKKVSLRTKKRREMVDRVIKEEFPEMEKEVEEF